MTNSFSVDYKLFRCPRPNLLTISYKCTYKVAECRQIVCQANCGVFEHLHHRLNPSVYLTHRFLRGRLRPPVASCRIVMWVLASSCWKVRISSNRLGCSFPTILFRWLCQPSRRLLVWPGRHSTCWWETFLQFKCPPSTSPPVSVSSLESPSKSYPYVDEMIHICRENESRQSEM